MKRKLLTIFLILSNLLPLHSQAQIVTVPEVLYIRTEMNVQGCAGSEISDVAAIWSNASQNLTVTRTFYANATCEGEPALTNTFEIMPPGLVTPVLLKITLPQGMQSCKFNVASQALNTSGCISLNVTPAPTRLYVNASATGANTGLTWQDAFTDLQSALNYSCSANLREIWVAKGTYYPDEGGSLADNDRNAAFTMKNNLAIYGGFAGTEATLNDRVVSLIHTTNKTTLSGDIDQNDGVDFSNTASNAYHVFFNNNSSLNSTAILDGFTVTAANANGNSNAIRWGAGMYNEFASPTLSNCIFTGNQAIDYGGGIYNFGVSAPVITNCVFSGNKARLGGSGVYNFSSSPTITNCSFSGNHGVALINQLSSAVLINCTFSGNYSASNGGAIINISATPTLRNCILWGNSSEVRNDSSTPTYSNTLVQGLNTGSFQGTENPRFVNQPDFNAAPTTAGNLRLLACSPALNAGLDADNSTAVDLDFNPRKFGVIDLGAYETQGNAIVITVSAPTVTQPSCVTPTGTIVVNASGTGTLEYSINNGTNWQTNATFSGLAAGNYTIKVRTQGSPSCEITYGSNPVVLTSPFTTTATDIWTGCVSTDWNTPGNWQDGTLPTVTDNVSIPNVTNDPVIGAGTAALAKSVLVQAGAILTINNTGSLAVNGSISPLHGLDNYGTLNNSGTIRVGNTAALGAIGIIHRNGGTFNNKPGGAIYIDQTGGSQAFYSNGLVNNEALINIGSNTAVTGEGIRLEGNTFNNKSGGSIQINQTGSTAIQLLNSGTILNNEALIEIGSQSDIRGSGIRNGSGCTFTNKVGGEIRINRVGILNTNVIGAIRNEATFTNDAMITIGNIGLVRAQDGILNVSGSFTNSATGVISIAKTWGNGIWNSSGTFQNAGKITISNIFDSSDGTYSTGILSTAPFSNTTGAQIHLDQVANGIASTNAFTNAGLIRMGENGPLTGSGIANIQGANAVFNNNAGGDISIKQTAVDGVQNELNSIFNNNACAKLTIFDNLNNAGTFTNAGLFTVNTAQAHTNSALTNNGIIEYPQGNPIPNVTNNDVIVTSVSDCLTTVTAALQIGGMNSFNAATAWYKDPALTQPAGTYDQNTNTFTANGLTAGNSYQLYFSVTDPVNMCARTVSINLTLNLLPVVNLPANELCTGQTFTLSPSSGGSWSSSNPAIASVNNQGLVSALTTGVVNFTFTAAGCSATTANVTIKPTPASALTASKVDVCPNTEVSLDAHCSIPTATVNWNPGAPTVTPAAATLPYIYKASCAFEGCTGNESSVEVRTHRILVDMKDLDVGTLPLPIARAVKDNMAPTNQINAPTFPRRWTFIANGCDASESAAFKLSGPVNFSTIDNAAAYAMFANDAGGFYSIDHPNYGNGGSFPNGTYTLTIELRSQDGVGGPFPKNRVATGSLLATRTVEFTVGSPSARVAAEGSDVFAVDGLGFAEIAPNPVFNIMLLKVREAKGQTVNVSLIDASGRTLLQRSFVPETHQHQEEFEVSNLANGIYFLRVSTDNKNATLKVVKVQ